MRAARENAQPLRSFRALQGCSPLLGPLPADVEGAWRTPWMEG